MGLFDRNGDGRADGMEMGRTLAEAGLWHESLKRQGGGGGSEPGCSCSGCLAAVAIAVGMVVGVVLALTD